MSGKIHQDVNCIQMDSTCRFTVAVARNVAPLVRHGLKLPGGGIFAPRIGIADYFELVAVEIPQQGSDEKPDGMLSEIARNKPNSELSRRGLRNRFVLKSRRSRRVHFRPSAVL